MAKTLDFRMYLAIERALMRRLLKDWHRRSASVYQAITDACNAGNWNEARRLVPTLDLTKVGTENREWLKYLLLSMATYGAGRVAKGQPSFVGVGSFDKTLNQVVDNLIRYLQNDATAQIQIDALQLIAKDEEARLAQKRNPYHDERGRFTTKDKAAVGGSRYKALIETGQERNIHPIALKAVEDTATKMGFPLERIEIRSGGASFELDGQWFEEGGHYDAQTGMVVMRVASLIVGDDRAVKEMVAHEITHDAYTTVMQSSSPEAQAFKDYLLLHSKELDTQDGVTQYSRAYWKEGEDALTRDRAIDETLAEISGVSEVSTSHYVAPVWKKAHALLMKAHQVELRTVKKADPTGRYVTPFVSFGQQGDAQLQLIASLNASRLATWGFTAEAEIRGVTRYRLTAVLDGRTSEFCRMIDGKEFEVESAREKITQVLNAQNPDDLRSLQPWPKQTRTSMAQLRELSTEELQQRGFHVPPFHPGCRTVCVMVDDEVRLEKPVPVAQEIAPQTITQDTMKELGIPATQKQVEHWNAYVGQSPVEILAELSNKPPREVLAWGLGSRAIQFADNGDIVMRARGVSESIKYAVGTVLDPFTGTYYLSEADLVAGNVEAAQSFMKRLFASLLKIGPGIGAKTLVIAVAGEAASYAKWGFVPSAADWQTIRMAALDAIQNGSLQAMYASLSESQKFLVLHLLQDVNESALGALVDLQVSYRGKTIGEWILQGVSGQFSLDLTDALTMQKAQALTGLVQKFNPYHDERGRFTSKDKVRGPNPVAVGEVEMPLRTPLASPMTEITERFNAIRNSIPLPLEWYGDTALIERMHAHDLGVLAKEAKIMALLREASITIDLSTGSVTKIPAFARLKGVCPRGWPPGSSWDDVNGLYACHLRKIVAGAPGLSGGSEGSVIAHETGHAVHHAVNIMLGDENSKWMDKLEEIWSRTIKVGGGVDYYKQSVATDYGKPAGLVEAFAESYSIYVHKGLAVLERKFGKEWTAEFWQALEMIRQIDPSKRPKPVRPKAKRRKK